MKFLILSVIILCFCFLGKTFAYDNKETHRDFSSAAAKKSTLSTENYLSNFGFKEGLSQQFTWSINTRSADEWAEDGAELEDAGSDFDAILGRARFKNHFHDPLKDWSEAGLSDTQQGMSMVLWAQDFSRQHEAIEGDWTWQTIRNRYLLALTAETEAEREEYFAKTFRGLGHQMHLIQDAGQPDHVRNDAHPFDGKGWRIHVGFEKWVKDNRLGIKNDFMNENSTPKFPPVYPSLNLKIPTEEGMVPITKLIDANLYTGTFPSAGTIQGLAEYTNSNFFSDNTIFAAERFSPGDKHYFPYPKASSTNLREYLDGPIVPEKTVALDGTEEFGIWIKKDWDGDVVNHLVRPSYFSKTVANLMGEGDLFYSSFYRDEKCHADYAQKLIPRAVGYSAALINYFFRGKINMEPDTGNSGQYVIKNESDEEMSGTFRLHYDDTNGQRKLVPGVDWSEWNLSIPANGQSSPVSFTAPSDAKEAGKYMLVFLGEYGAESGAVVGKEVDLQSKDGVIKIRLTGPDGGQIKRDIIFNVWAKRKDTGVLCKIAATAWKYNDVAGYWEVIVPSLSDAIEYNATYNRYDTVTPVGGFDLAQGVYLDYLWKAASVGVWPTTYTGKGGYYGYTYHEEETRNLAQNPISLGLKIGYKPNTQPIPGIEVLTIFQDSYNNYSVQLVYDAAKKKISLAGVSELVVGANDEGIYGLSQGYSGYSSMIIKVTPSALPTTNYSAEFSINSGLDNSKIIKTGSVWTQYPGKYRSDQRYLPASKLNLMQNMVLEDVVPYIYSERTYSMQVTSIELNSNMKYTINYNGAFYGALWRNLDAPSEIGLGVEGEGYCWTIWRGDSSYVLWDNVNGKCGGSPRYNPLSWVPSGSTAWVDTDIGSYSLFPVSLIQYKNFEFTPGTRTHYIAGNDSIPSTLTVSSKNNTTNYSLQEQYPRISKSLNGPNILLRD